MAVSRLPAEVAQVSDMVKRAAQALFDDCAGGADAALMDMAAAICEQQARITLLAALDPEDEALVNAAAKAIFTAAHTRGFVGDNVIALPWEPQIEEIKREYRDFGRAAIASLKTMAQGGSAAPKDEPL